MPEPLQNAEELKRALSISRFPFPKQGFSGSQELLGLVVSWNATPREDGLLNVELTITNNTSLVLIDATVWITRMGDWIGMFGVFQRNDLFKQRYVQVTPGVYTISITPQHEQQ